MKGEHLDVRDIGSHRARCGSHGGDGERIDDLEKGLQRAVLCTVPHVIGGSAGRVTATRVGNGDTDGSRRLVVDFEGGKLSNLAANASVKAVITVGEEGELVQQSTIKNPVTGGWRLALQVKLPKDKPLELRAFLQSDNDALTETWSYQLSP